VNYKLSSALLAGLALSACERSSELESRALKRFGEYCAREKIACDKSMLESAEYGWFQGRFSFVISENPDHFVVVTVHRNAGTEVSRWNDRDHK